MGAGDADAAAPCLAQDAYTLAKGFGHFAGVREYPTILATIRAFKTLIPDGLKIDILSITDAEDRVVVEFEGTARTIEGKDYNNQYCMVFTLQEGKISQVNEYFCTILADEVLWPLVQQTVR
jgi:ketosteroid isomerase-like protein